MFSWWQLVGLILISAFLCFLAEARQRQQNNHRDDNSQDDSCLVSEEPKRTDEKLCKCFAREPEPFGRWLISQRKHFIQPCEFSAKQREPHKNRTKKQPKNCQNIVKEAEIFWLFKKMPSAPACPADCACKAGSRFFCVLHAISKWLLLPSALCSRDSTVSPVLHREQHPCQWHHSADAPSLNRWSQPY